MMARRGKRSSIDPAGVRSRASRAKSFLDLAELGVESQEPSDRAASISNAINAGIAASDAIAGHRIGEHAQGEDHAEAIMVLKEALSPHGDAAARDLGRLLTAKTPSQYGTQCFSLRESKEHLERARRLIAMMDEVLRG